MKGDFEFLNIIFALLIFMSTIVFIVFMIRGNILAFGGSVTVDMNKIKAMEASYMVEHCLTTIDKGDSNYILAKTLDKHNLKSIKDVCKIEEPDIKVNVVDMETYRTWGFVTAITDPDHEIWISIKYDDKVNMGKLYVDV